MNEVGRKLCFYLSHRQPHFASNACEAVDKGGRPQEDGARGADSRTARSRERVTAVPPQPTLGGPPPRRGDRWAAPSWPRRGGGDVSILAAALAPDRRSGPRGSRQSRGAGDTHPPEPRTGSRPPSSSPTGREGRRRPSRGDPVGARRAGGLGQLGALPPGRSLLSPPGAAPLVAGVEPAAAAAASSPGEVALERGRFRPPGPAQPWSHAVADAPSAPSDLRHPASPSPVSLAGYHRNARWVAAAGQVPAFVGATDLAARPGRPRDGAGSAPRGSRHLGRSTVAAALSTPARTPAARSERAIRARQPHRQRRGRTPRRGQPWSLPPNAR